LEANRNRLKEPWNPNQDFANFWTKIKTVRQIATDGANAITDNTTIKLTIQALRSAGVYAHAITTWDDKPDAEQTWANFQTHFTQQDKNRLHNLTAAAAGFHSAHQADTMPGPPQAATLPGPPHLVTDSRDCHYRSTSTRMPKIAMVAPRLIFVWQT
jgi:hypothetical protein